MDCLGAAERAVEEREKQGVSKRESKMQTHAEYTACQILAPRLGSLKHGLTEALYLMSRIGFWRFRVIVMVLLCGRGCKSGWIVSSRR